MEKEKKESLSFSEKLIRRAGAASYAYEQYGSLYLLPDAGNAGESRRVFLSRKHGKTVGTERNRFFWQAETFAEMRDEMIRRIEQLLKRSEDGKEKKKTEEDEPMVDEKEEDLDFLAKSAYEDACAPGNPKDASIEDLKIYSEN